MTGGIIQLVAYGIQDLFITSDPQITFFKMVYRRYTNFSTEVIAQPFNHTADFGRRVTCVLARNGDLIRKVHLVAILPRIPNFKDSDGVDDTITKFAWVRRVGYALIKTVDVEIGSELIDRQYGDWLNIWHELTITHNKNIDKLIGDIEELVDYSNGKSSYKLVIPLQFWFNRIAGLALPTISLQYSHIKINIELNKIENCYNIVPTHYIEIDNDLVNFEPFEYILQNIDGITSIAQFINFDITTRRMYINRITTETFQSLSINPVLVPLEADQDRELYKTFNDANNVPTLVNEKYLIKGFKSKFEAMPKINAIERNHRNNTVNFENIFMKDSYLLIEHVFLDEEERVRFAQAKHEYLIEQVLFNGEKTIDGIHKNINIGLTQPCKQMIWVTQLTQARNINDWFNYTDNLVKDRNGKAIGKNIIKEETLVFNGQERISFRSYRYFGYVQPYQYYDNSPSEGINIYSFSLHPEDIQPSGQANLSKIDLIQLKLTVNTKITFTNTAKLRVYGIVYNVLRVANGISALVFSNDVEL